MLKAAITRVTWGLNHEFGLQHSISGDSAKRKVSADYATAGVSAY